MKNLKLMTFLYAALFITLSSYGQERQNASTMAFEKKSDKLTEATGWCFFRGQWTDNKNLIDITKGTVINSHEKNFSWMQMGIVNNNGAKYHVLFYDVLTGDYEFPLTRENWRERNAVRVWIINNDEYTQLKDAVLKKEAKDIDIKSKIDHRQILVAADQYNDTKVLGIVTEALQKNVSNENGSDCIKINSQTVSGQDVVRFLLPNDCGLTSLQRGYFEVKLDDFKKLLID
jgi:hypothetical protein